MPILKAELHTHINLDPQDKKFITYGAKELIDKAAEQGFQVLGISCHDYFFYDHKITEYALRKNIMLINGIEKTLLKKHMLVHNLTPETAKKVLDANSFSDIRQIKTEHPEILIIAAHPFHYGPSCLGKEALLHHELFDAWEYSFFHTSLFNPNRKTVKLAKKINKPLVGNSDVHFLKDLGRTYTLIDVDILTNDSKNSATSTTDYRARILQAIKEGKTEVVTNPIPLREFLTIAVKICKNMAVKFFLKKS